MRDLIGQIVGTCRVEKGLGSGELGQVMLGRQIYQDRWIQAVKVIYERRANAPGFAEQFEQVRRTAALLKHPHIIEIYDSGQHNGLSFVTMEYLPSGSLRVLLQSRPAQGAFLIFLLDLMRQAADALAYAHSNGMLHRNIKPNNLLLAVQPNNPDPMMAYTLKVADFGMARLYDEVLETPDDVTADTLTYATPEWVEGKELTAQSDIYALGVVLYEIATGYPPLETKTFSDVVRHIYSQPLPPSQRVPDIHPDLEELILRCLMKRPEQRFASAADLSTALRTVGETLARLLSPSSSATLQMLRKMTTPRVQVINEQGQALRSVNLTGRGLIVGQGAGNIFSHDDYISIPSDYLTAQQLRIDWYGNQVGVTLLQDNERLPITLDTGPLTAQNEQLWPGDTFLQVGTYRLLLEFPPDLVETASNGTSPNGSDPDHGETKVVQSRSKVGMSLDETGLILTPGRLSSLRLTVMNLGKLVDMFTVGVDGVPMSWVGQPLPGARLNPGEQKLLTLNVNVPRNSKSLAGDYPVKILVYPKNDPDNPGVEQMTWTVLPFHDTRLEVKKRDRFRFGLVIFGFLRTHYNVIMENKGNDTEIFNVDMLETDELHHRFKGYHTNITLNPGERQKLDLRVRPLRVVWGGSTKTYPFTVEATPEGSEEVRRTTGRLEQWGIPWMRILAMLLLLLLLFFGYGYGLLPIPLAVRLPLYSFLNPPTATPIPPTPAPIPTLPPPPPPPTETLTPTPTDTAIPTETATPFPTDTATPEPTVPTLTFTPSATPTIGPNCLAERQVRIAGFGPPNTPVLIYFGDRAVGGGVTDRSGNFVITLIMGREAPGLYDVTVRVRGTNQELRPPIVSIICVVPGTPTATPVTTPTLAGG